MGMKELFNKRDSLTEELRMLPRDTKKRILENVSRRRNEILEEKMLEKQLKGFDPKDQSDKRTFSKFREGMHKRRQEMLDKGIIQPPVRVNRENFRSPMEEASKRARAAEIKKNEDQRNRMKSGSLLEDSPMVKLKDLKLKIPKGTGILAKKKGGKNNGFI